MLFSFWLELLLRNVLCNELLGYLCFRSTTQKQFDALSRYSRRQLILTSIIFNRSLYFPKLFILSRLVINLCSKELNPRGLWARYRGIFQCGMVRRSLLR